MAIKSSSCTLLVLDICDPKEVIYRISHPAKFRFRLAFTDQEQLRGASAKRFKALEQLLLKLL